MLIIVVLAIQVMIIAVAAYLGREKLKKLIKQNNSTEVNVSNLHDIDRIILKFIEDRQGLVYQSEIVKELGLPKSTVHKALRRLSEEGYIEIQKRGKFNVVILKTTLEVSTT